MILLSTRNIEEHVTAEFLENTKVIRYFSNELGGNLC